MSAPTAFQRGVRGFRPALICAIYLALHLASNYLTQEFAGGPRYGLRLAPGLAMAMLILGGPRYTVAVLAAHVISSFGISPFLPGGWEQLTLPVIKTAGYSITAWFVWRRLGPAPIPRNRRESALLIAATFLAPVPGVLAATVMLRSHGFVPEAATLTGSLLRCLGGACSILTLVPAAIVHVGPWLLPDRREKTPPPTRPQRLEGVGQALALLLTFWLLYAWAPLGGRHGLPLYFVPLAWIALSRGLPGATIAILVIYLGNFGALWFGHAPPDVLIDLVLFSLAFAVVGLGLGTAVTQRSRVEAALALSQQRLAQTHAASRLGSWDCDFVAGRVTYDRAWAEMLDYRLEDVPRHLGWWEGRLHPDDRARVEGLLAEHFAGRAPFYEAEFRFLTGAGMWKWVHARGSIVGRDAGGRPLRLAGTQLDLTDRRLAEAETNRLLNIIEASPDFIASAELDGRTLYLNPAALRLRGLPHLGAARGTALFAFFPAWAAKKMSGDAIPTTLAQGGWVGEAALLDVQGREIPVSLHVVLHHDDAGRPSAISCIMRDITRQRELEASRLATERKMLQAQKLESLGLLAGGIAHDFNNLLTVMLGHVSLAQFQLPPGSPTTDNLSQIRASALRASELCKQLLAYSGKGQFSPTLTDLSALVEETAHLLRISIGRKSQMEFNLAPRLPPVRVDVTQIRQIVMNLVINASDAIGDREGLIRITTGLVRADEAYFAATYLEPDLPRGEYVFLEVADNGCGMTPEVKTRIFEPFFSTKFTGRGLGLSAAVGIVRGHHGALRVYSEPGRGSTFKLLLPAVTGVAPPSPSAAPALPMRGDGLVLVIDDEETVRTIAGRILESCGFSAVLASDGPEALRLFAARPADFSAVLLDLTMPQMSGEETLRELRRLRSDIPVALMSGFSEEDTATRTAGSGAAAFIPKPFDRNTLVRKVQKLIAERTEPTPV